jgi:hypothetical protein
MSPQVRLDWLPLHPWPRSRPRRRSFLQLHCGSVRR